MNRSDHATSADLPVLAESIRRALIQAGEAAYEDAGIRGLCAEGRWEAAVAAMRAVDLDALVHDAAASADPHPPATGRASPSGL